MQPMTPATPASETVGTYQKAEAGQSRGSTVRNRKDRSGGRQKLFSIRFKSSMSDTDASRLQRELDLVTYLTPKPGVSGASPGVVRLDDWSGLFLARGHNDGEWILEGRTWNDPPQPVAHDWHLRAALAARALDPTVQIPPPLEQSRQDAILTPLRQAARCRTISC